MDRINLEAFGLGCPLLANEFIRGQALQRLESAAKVVGVDKVGEVLPQLRMIVIVEALNGSFFDGPIHSLNLSVSPRMLNFGEAMFNVMLIAGATKNVIASVPIAGTVRKLDAVIGQYRMEGVWHCLDQIAQELGRNHLAGLGMELGKSELGGSVNGHKQIQLAFGCLHLGNVDVKVADWVALELLLGRLVALNLWQSRDAMTLQTSMQRRARQMRDSRLQP